MNPWCLPGWAPVVGDDAGGGGPVHQSASDDHSRDLRCIADVDSGIGIEKDDVGALSHRNGALRASPAQEYRRIESGGLQSFQRSESSISQPLQFIMKAEAGNLTVTTRQNAVAVRAKIAKGPWCD